MIDDGFDHHPKVVELQKLPPGRFACAIALWTLAGCHAQRGDGTVPIEILNQIRITSPLRSAADLVAVSLWIQVDSRTYRYHDWEDYNETVGEKSAKRLANRARQRRHREKRNAESNALQGVTVTPPRPVPSRPVLDPPCSPPEGDVPEQADLELAHEEPKADPYKQVFHTWAELHTTRPGQTKLNEGKRRTIRKLLKDGYTVDQMRAALRGALADPWTMGTDRNSTSAFRDLEQILKTGSKVERLAALDGQKPAAPGGMAPVGDFSDVDDNEVRAGLRRRYGTPQEPD